LDSVLPKRETTKSKKEVDAKRLLKKREGEISEGKLPGIVAFKGKWTDLRYRKETVLGYNHDRERRTRWNLKSVLDTWSSLQVSPPHPSPWAYTWRGGWQDGEEDTH
jgi:hypothetical protein